MEQGSGWGGGEGSWGQGKFFSNRSTDFANFPLTHDLINESPLIPTNSGSSLN